MENKQLKIFILILLTWVMIWGGYNTGIERVMSIGFPHNLLDLIHGLRAFLPIIAAVFSFLFIVLYKKENLDKKFFLTPIGLIILYTIIGSFSSIFSKNVSEAFYWSLMYGSVALVMWAIIGSKNCLEKISFIFFLNLIIAAVISIGLFVFFVSNTPAHRYLNINSMFCFERPYETMGEIRAQDQIMGMVGTRPTGFGRYAGMAAVILFSFAVLSKEKSKTILYTIIFLIFLGILFFAKGRTEVIAFVAAIFIVLWISKKIISKWSIILILSIIFSILIIFYNIPCQKEAFSPDFLTKNFISHTASGTDKNINTIITLSGRTNGVWTDAWQLFKSSPMMGYGFQADRIFLNGQHAHNTLVHALLQTGLLGTIPLLLAYIIILLYIYRLLIDKNINIDKKIFLVALTGSLIFFLVRGITESAAFYSADWIFIAPIIAYIQCLYVDSKNNNRGNKMTFSGLSIDIIKMSEVLNKISYWMKNEKNKSHWIVATGMHGVVESSRHQDFKYVLNHSDMFVPDGISLVWLAKLKGFSIKERITGSDLMEEILKMSSEKGYKNYFYGDTEDTLTQLSKKFKNIKTDFYSPPFRELTDEESELIINRINESKSDILWVGLGLPKQEKWIFKNREKIKVTLVIGVGAAFKFLSGKIDRAPKIIGNLGFEWLWRLFKEPKIIWKRVFLDSPIFGILVMKDILENNR